MFGGKQKCSLTLTGLRSRIRGKNGGYNYMNVPVAREVFFELKAFFTAGRSNSSFDIYLALAEASIPFADGHEGLSDE